MTDPTPPVLVSVLIVNYNSGPYLARCLRSIPHAFTPPGGSEPVAHEILVADNDSADDSLARAQATGVAAEFVATGANLGFGKAMNLLAKRARGTWLFLLNPDSELVGMGWWEALMAFLRQHPRAGVVGPRIMNSDGSFQTACIRGEPTLWRSFGQMSGLGQRFPQSRLFAGYHLGWLDRDQPQRVHAVSGSALFIRRRLYETIGGFDERFFLFAEDLDLCRRAAQAALPGETLEGGPTAGPPAFYDVWYDPALRLTHHKGKCSEARPAFVRHHFYHAMALYYDKHYRHGLGRLWWPLVRWLTRWMGREERG